MSMTTTNSDEVSAVRAARSVPFVAGDTPAMREWAEELVARAQGGELRARRVLERTGELLGIGIANIINGVGISQVVISGEIVRGWDLIRTSLHETVGSDDA
jgi:predicted NBD/HSP70 family sugar kinase